MRLIVASEVAVTPAVYSLNKSILFNKILPVEIFSAPNNFKIAASFSFAVLNLSILFVFRLSKEHHLSQIVQNLYPTPACCNLSKEPRNLVPASAPNNEYLLKHLDSTNRLFYT